MIPGIHEYTRISGQLPQEPNGLWLNSTGTLKASLFQATVTFEEMGERTITTQVRIDGDVVPSFAGWELEFRGEYFVLPTLKPQASKDNSTRNSLVDLVFTSSYIHDLKRYYFASMSYIENGVGNGHNIIDNYNASLRLDLTDFVAAFNKVLQYYFPDGSYYIDLNSSADDGEVKEFEIDYMYLWDVLSKMYDVYNVSWKAVRNSSGHVIIKVGYDMGEIDDHTFEYGFDGGLLRFERHVEDTDIYNVLLGRGGEKNIPYRYFKYTDPYNPIWTADPDAIHELRDVFFSRLLDANFRSYVQGWKTNSHRFLEEGESLATYDSSRGATDWAYKKGHDDTKFDPVEYVKDDDSIALYGVRQGKLEDNDDIYPTIQGVTVSPYGRVDEVIDVEVTAEDDPDAISDIVITVPQIYEDIENISSEAYRLNVESTDTFTVPTGRVGRMEYAYIDDATSQHGYVYGYIDTTNSFVYVKYNDTVIRDISAIPAGGPYKYGAALRIKHGTISDYDIRGRFGLKNVAIHNTHPGNISYRSIFTIWVKNIWQTTQGQDESDVDYAHRVWDSILGNKLGESAAIHFSTGPMSTSEDYEFLIQKLPEVDRTKTYNGYTSEWKITLLRSDAEYEATGLYVPNTQTGGVPTAGNYFFFTGIDIPFYYVRWAENKLRDTKQAALTNDAWTNPTWVVTLDKIKAQMDGGLDYVGTLAERLDAGVIISISDKRFTRNSRDEQVAIQLGIRTVSFSWNEPTDGNPYLVPDIEVTLSDKIVREVSYDGMKKEINYISRNYATTSSVKKMAKSTNVYNGVGIDGNLCYIGTVIGTVEE